MEGFKDTQPGSELPGDAWARWPKSGTSVAERSTGIDLGEHLTESEVAEFSLEAAELGMNNPERFLRNQIVRFGDICEENPKLTAEQLPDFIRQYLAAAGDGTYA